MALNRKRPFGEVIGAGVPYRYEQDGKYFNQDGDEVTTEGKPVKGGKTTVAEVAPPAPAVPPPVPTETTGPVPESEIDAVSGEDVAIPEELDALTVPEIKDLLDKLDVRYRANVSKSDLLAMLRDEMAQREIEKGQDE